MKKLAWITLGVVLAGLLLPPLIAPVFFPWSPINCWDEEINIKTGQARYTRSLWFVTVSTRVEDTPLSEAIRGEIVDVSDIEPWHRVNTFSPGIHYSPHYRFHAALHQAKQLDVAFQILDVGPEDRQAVAKEVLRLWQVDGNYSGAERLVHELMEKGTTTR
ncbi:MAG: hypothetical protein GXX96_23235 [Planctomycetaceae bacterium]|nr:hypothetical protein [Planctomycetaceae bacterium]